MQFVNEKYEFLSSEPLRNQIRDYYIQKRPRLDKVSVRSPEIDEINLQNLRTRIREDYDALITEYIELTSTLT